MNTVIHTPAAPAAIGPYSQAIKAGSLVFTSGQIGLNPQTGELVEGIESQARQVFANLEQVIGASGGNLSDVVKFTVFLTDLKDFALVNSIMQEKLDAPYPARSCMQVAALPKGALVEVEAVVALSE